MSDQQYEVFQHYGTNADRLAFTPDPAAGIQPIYIWYESDTDDVYIFTTTWHLVTAGGGGGNVNASSTLTNHAIVLGRSSTDVAVLGSLGTNHQVLHGAATGDPSFGAVDLANDVTGTLPSSNLTTAIRTSGLQVTIDGNGSAISTGVAVDIYCPFACTITANTMLADQSGSIVLDLWKDILANYPPTIADTITASAKPTISSATHSQDNTLTGWTTSVSAGDTIRINVDSVTSITRLTFTLTVIK